MECAFGENGYARLTAERAQYGGKEYVAFMFSDITSEQEKTTKLKQELDAALGQAAAKSSFLSKAQSFAFSIPLMVFRVFHARSDRNSRADNANSQLPV